LVFDPKAAGPNRDQAHYQLKPLSLTDMKRFALRASKIRANLLERAAALENEQVLNDSKAVIENERLVKKLYRAKNWTRLQEFKKLTKE